MLSHFRTSPVVSQEPVCVEIYRKSDIHRRTRNSHLRERAQLKCTWTFRKSLLCGNVRNKSAVHESRDSRFARASQDAHGNFTFCVEVCRLRAVCESRGIGPAAICSPGTATVRDITAWTERCCTSTGPPRRWHSLAAAGSSPSCSLTGVDLVSICAGYLRVMSLSR